MTGTDEAVPPWVQFIRGDIASMEGRINGRLDKMVSTDLFTAEQMRVEGRFSDLADDIKAAASANAQLELKLGVERSERQAEERKAADAESARIRDHEAQQSRNRWTLFAVLAGPVVGAIAAFIIAGGLRITP